MLKFIIRILYFILAFIPFLIVFPATAAAEASMNSPNWKYFKKFWIDIIFYWR